MKINQTSPRDRKRSRGEGHPSEEPIFWTLQAIGGLIDIRKVGDPGLFLGAREKEKFNSFRIEKRRQEWLGARLALKRLIWAVDARWERKPFPDMEVLSEAGGAPYLALAGGGRMPGSISFSHAHGFALCAYSPLEISLGVDLERVEPRIAVFVEDYFTEMEIEAVQSAAPGQRDLTATLIWSAKEAVLKALKLGLRVDTRSLTVLRAGQPGGTSDWAGLGLETDLAERNALSLAWRKEADFVLTACTRYGWVDALTRVEL